MSTFYQTIRQSRSIYMLLIVSFITILGYGTQRVLVPIYLEDIGMGALAIGFFLYLGLFVQL